MGARDFLLAGVLSALASAPPPPGKVPAGVILVKGACSSASDATTPVPEGGKASARDYENGYFRLSYPFAAGWRQMFEGPPPSDRGYYVLSQVEPAEGHIGNVLIEAQDLFFAPVAGATELVRYTGAHLRLTMWWRVAPSQVTLGGRSFARLDYVSPALQLHSCPCCD